VKQILMILIGLVVLILLVAYKLDLSAFATIVLERMSWFFYFFISLLIIVQLLLRSIRFRILISGFSGYSISFLDSFILTAASNFIALATPNKSGDLLRGLFIKKYRWEVTAVSILEYLFDVFVVITVPAISFCIVFNERITQIAGAYFAAVFVLIVLFYLFKYCNFQVIRKVKWLGKFNDKVGLLKVHMSDLFKNKFSLFYAMVLSVFSYGCYFIIFYLVLHRLNAHTTFLETIVASGVGVFVGSLTFIPMGLGSRDISSYGMLLSLGTDAELALASVVIMRSLTLSVLVVSCIGYFVSINRFNKQYT